MDWEVWTGSLADSREDFAAIVDPLQKFINESPGRVPLTDWYWTTDGKQVGFQARSVVGGVYIPLLARDQIWKKWSKLPFPSSGQSAAGPRLAVRSAHSSADSERFRAKKQKVPAET